MTFTTSSGKSYKYSNQTSLNYSVAHIDYNFAPIDFEFTSTTTKPQGSQNISTVNMSIGRSDVAVNIPITNIINNKTFAVIIANENYQSEMNVDFARNDGETFREYCIKTLGLPESNVHFVADATLNNIRREINWLSQVANAFLGETSIIFYYAGHGIPDESSRSAYLLPEGVYELRAEYEGNIYRIFFCFDEGHVVILFNGFHKKNQKTPENEIRKAINLKNEYYARTN